jgi:hypothetical protein
MSKKLLEVAKQFGRDVEAEYIAHTWFKYNSQRQPKIEAWKELRNYIFATDTTTTTNKTLPWKNSTTLPKLCQIRDNLHSNYISALFPNDSWMKWEGYSREDAIKKKSQSIEAYMANKCRQNHFRTEVSKLLYDYIDYGNAFATADYEQSFVEDTAGNRIIDYIGPKSRRISPLDIVFNPLANSFKDSWKIVRSLKNIGELALMGKDEPDNAYLQNAIKNRQEFKKYMNAYGIEEGDKAEGLLVDGFGNYSEYLGSDYVEFLEFYGDLYNSETMEVQRAIKIVVVDRMWVVYKEPIKEWFGHAPIFHVGWRTRPDNLWSMGPLDNLVGLQYRIDHLENLKADAMDISVHPPLVIKGEVEEFEYRPGVEIHIDENGSVEELGRNTQWALVANNDIARLEMLMEQYAGAPREAMGIRSPGEKTMFEVQQLQNAAGRIFQEKITHFEIEMLEKLLNAMLETAKRNLDREDIARVTDNDIGIIDFIEITREDITASGKLRPIGARHFAAQAQIVQNLTGIANTPVWQQIAPHISNKKLASLVEEMLNLQKFDLVSPNVAVFEQQETAMIMNQVSEDAEVAQSQPVQ